MSTTPDPSLPDQLATPVSPVAARGARGAEGPVTDRHASLWRDLRKDPAHTAEIAVRHAQPLLAPHVAKWWSDTQVAHPSDAPERVARRVVRRSAGVARRGGLITGSSLYVGMVPALVMVYCQQVVLVLRIAAAFGREPGDPIRGAEFLHLQGRHPTVRAAALALRDAGQVAPRRASACDVKSVVQVARQAPSMIGIRISRFRDRSLVDKAIGAVEVASYFVPFVSMPIWAFANARATRRLGRAAVAFYGTDATGQEALPDLAARARPTPRTRRLVIGTVVPLALAMGVLVALFPLGPVHHGFRWAGLAIGEAVLVFTFARLIRLTRPTRA